MAKVIDTKPRPSNPDQIVDTIELDGPDLPMLVAHLKKQSRKRLGMVSSSSFTTLRRRTMSDESGEQDTTISECPTARRSITSGHIYPRSGSVQSLAPYSNTPDGNAAGRANCDIWKNVKLNELVQAMGPDCVNEGSCLGECVKSGNAFKSNPPSDPSTPSAELEGSYSLVPTQGNPALFHTVFTITGIKFTNTTEIAQFCKCEEF